MDACILCGGEASKTVAGMSFDSDCIKDSVIPLFRKAAKYEVDYPPPFGPGIRLSPEDFIESFDDGEQFVKLWDRRVQEYETPFASRAYCKCEAFLCRKPQDGVVFNMHCMHCGRLQCFPCGQDVTYSPSSHTCPLKDNDSEDRFEGMERGEEYQICPNDQCRMPVNLHSGCNHMKCENVTCKAEFCYICGQHVTGANSGYWDQGMPCPRFNQPGAPNAIFDNNHLEDGPQDLQGADEWERDATLPANPLAADQDLLLEVLGEEEYERRILQVVDLLPNIPALPANISTLTDRQQAQAEGDMANELETSPLGQVMLQHQHELETMIEIAEAQIMEAQDEGFETPPWAQTALGLMEDLRDNLDMYVYRVRLSQSFDLFELRNNELTLAYGTHQPTMFAHFRRFYEILAPYSNVTGIRLSGVPQAMRAGLSEEVAVRGEVAATARIFAAHRRPREFEQALGVRPDTARQFAALLNEAVEGLMQNADALREVLRPGNEHLRLRLETEIARREAEQREIAALREEVAATRRQLEQVLARGRGMREGLQGDADDGEARPGGNADEEL